MGKVALKRLLHIFGQKFQRRFTHGATFFFSDPYLNTDAGTMSPFEHGEVYVLDDGGEVRYFLFFSVNCKVDLQV
jgi:CTP synthase N-terminus